jgi:hypothetical protein
VQFVDPEIAEYVPRGQLVQFELAVEKNFPTPHERQSRLEVLPGAIENVPFLHVAHDVAPRPVEKVPIPH